MKRWLLIALIAYAGWHWWSERPVHVSMYAMTVMADPDQRSLSGPVPKFYKKGYDITALAKFSLQARVLSAEDYYFDRETDLVPVDLALGWGPMSDPQVLSKISISQGGRF